MANTMTIVIVSLWRTEYWYSYWYSY